MGSLLISVCSLRWFDRSETTGVTVLTQSMAQRYFSGVDPIGRTFALHTAPAKALQVVGVVSDVMSTGGDPAPYPAFHVPYSQSPGPMMTMVMRVPRGDVAIPQRRSELYGASPGDPVTFVAVSVAIVLVAVPCVAPAMTAARVERLRALRE